LSEFVFWKPIMQIYPIHTSFTAGESFELAVQPKRRFGVAIYQQGGDELLLFCSGVVVEGQKNVKASLVDGHTIFESAGSNDAAPFDHDWNWPTIRIRPDLPAHEALSSGAYVAVAYEVTAAGKPRDEAGRRCLGRKPVSGAPPASDSMALVVARPRIPTAPIAYIVPVATYHAYNSIGGGCYYNDPIHRRPAAMQVSLRRPGGGLGAQLGEPVDPYDSASPRQQFSHWDAKFIRWLRAEGIACDFYTDLDLHEGSALDLTKYSCMLSVGHHEYWSHEMREHVARFVEQGGNLAVFSGNTCYRPVKFTCDAAGNPIGMRKLAGDWDLLTEKPNNDPRACGNERHLIGLSYTYGGGHYGRWKRWRGGWINRKREAVGFTVTQPEHWVFTGTGLKKGETFGADDRLVGYEVDGLPADEPHNGFETLASTRQLTGWEMGGIGAFGMFRPKNPAGTLSEGQVFNCGTTDWARVLLDTQAKSNLVVQRITRNVVRRFIGLSFDGASHQDNRRAPREATETPAVDDTAAI
jgi:hypothetical protein